MTNPAFINPRQIDTSAETKDLTRYTELFDVTQFALMTTISEGIDAGAQYGFGIKNFIPAPALLGLELAAYLFMIGLAYERSKKYKIRREFFHDKNSENYYEETASALLAALTEEERSALQAEAGPSISDQKKRIVHLLRSDARAINPSNLPATWTLIDRWQGIFAKAKKRSAYAEKRFSHFDIKEKINTIDPEFKFDFQGFHGSTWESMEEAYVFAVLKQYGGKDHEIQAFHARKLIAELSRVQKTTPITDPVRMVQAENEVLLNYADTDHGKILSLLSAFYEHYHSYQDNNDKAFYLANRRGILEYEKTRTQFKHCFYGMVSGLSVVALAYSIGSLATVFTTKLTPHQILLPLFLVGSTSLIDESIDLAYKVHKYHLSKKNLKDWLSLEINQDAVAMINKDHYFKKHEEEIQHFSLGIRNEKEPFDLQTHGQAFLDAKHKEHQALQERVDRRWIKTKQACASFTGVFFGVALAMTMTLLTVLYEARVEHMVDMMAFGGFATIGIAIGAGLYMIHYQGQRSRQKASLMKAAAEHELEDLSPSKSTVYPKRFSQSTAPSSPPTEETSLTKSSQIVYS